MSHLLIFLHVEGVEPVGFQIAIEDLQDVLDNLKPLHEVGLDFERLVALFAGEFLVAVNKSDKQHQLRIAMGALWTAFNCPRVPQMREMVSLMIRRRETPTLTWRLGPEGFGLALAGQFVDVAAIQARAPAQSVAYFAPPPEPGPMN